MAETGKEHLNKLERMASDKIISAIESGKTNVEVKMIAQEYFTMIDQHSQLGYYNHKNFSYVLKRYNRYIGTNEETEF